MLTPKEIKSKEFKDFCRVMASNNLFSSTEELNKAYKKENNISGIDSAYDEAVVHPKHYNEIPNWEVIDIIRRDLNKEEYIGFLKGNILKYRLRAGYKGDVIQDIDKANYYKDLLLGFLSKDNFK